MEINVTSAESINPQEAPVRPMSELQGAGVNLAKWLLVIISSFLIISIIFLLITEVSSANFIRANQQEIIKSDTNGTAITAFMEQVKLQRKEFRDFWLQLMQMVLLNLLLPVLTGILGYIFGTRDNEKD